MTRNSKKNEVANTGFFFALLLLLFLSKYSYDSFRSSNENEKWIRHTSLVLQTSNEVLSKITEAETAVRGYVITGDKIYLAPYYLSLERRDGLIKQLERLTANDNGQQLGIGILKSLISQKYMVMERVFTIREQSGLAEVVSFAGDNKGKIIMDSIRHLSKMINQVEQQHLAQHSREMEETIERTRLTLIVGTIISMGIFIVIFFAFNKQLIKRRKNEEKLFIQNQMFTQTLLSLGDGVITTDTSGHITMINRASCEMSGWSKEEAVGKHIEEVFDIVSEITGDKQINPAILAMKDNKISFLENGTLLIKKDGSQITIDDSGAPIHNKEGETIGSVLIFRDVTGKKKAEQELKIFHKISKDMIGIAELDGYFKSVNPAFSEILGYTAEEFMAQPFLDFVHPEDVQKTLDEMESLSKGHSAINFINLNALHRE